MLFVIVTMMISALCVVFNFYDNVSALCVSFDCYDNYDCTICCFSLLR